MRVVNRVVTAAAVHDEKSLLTESAIILMLCGHKLYGMSGFLTDLCYCLMHDALRLRRASSQARGPMSCFVGTGFVG